MTNDLNKDIFKELSYDVVLPSQIIFNKNIEPSAIRLYAVLRGLTRICGYCFATNKYLGDSLDISEATVKRLLKSLNDEGFIETTFDVDGLNHQRKIYLSDNFKKSLRKIENELPPVLNQPPPSSNSSCRYKDMYYKEEYSNKNPPPLSSKEPAKDSLSDWRKMKISEGWTEEEIKKSIDKLNQKKPGEVNNLFKWLDTVLQSIRSEADMRRMSQNASNSALNALGSINDQNRCHGSDAMVRAYLTSIRSNPSIFEALRALRIRESGNYIEFERLDGKYNKVYFDCSGAIEQIKNELRKMNIII